MKIKVFQFNFSYIILFLGSSILFLSSCSNRFTSGSIYDAILNKLEINMTIKEVENLINPPSNSIEINQNDLKNYVVQYYYEYREFSSNPVALCFQNGKLVFWGYPHEFARLENAELNKVIKIANAEKIRLDAKKNND